MKTILSNGAVIEGTPEQIMELFSKRPDLRPRGPVYNSKTHGTILISGMETHHIKNALLNKYKEWIGGLYAITDPGELAATIVDGPGEEGSEFHHLLAELSRRTE